MTLRDEHLQQALRHAPDQDLAPDAVTRRAVLDYAAQGIAPRSNWLLRLWQAPAWQLAGFSAAMAALLVLVVVWSRPEPDLPIQVASAPVPAPSPIDQQKAAALPESSLPAGAGTKSNVSPAASANGAVTDAVSPSTSVPAKIVVAAAEPKVARGPDKLGSKGQDLDQQLPAVPAGKVVIPDMPAAESRLPVDRTEVASAEKEIAAPAPAAPVVMDADGSAASMRQASKAMSEKKRAPVDAAKSERVRREGVVTAPPASDLAAGKARGAENAARDIRAGNLRIHALARSWPVGKPLVDEATGYRVELVGDSGAGEAIVAEMEAYNQVMRQWHAEAVH